MRRSRSTERRSKRTRCLLIWAACNLTVLRFSLSSFPSSTTCVVVVVAIVDCDEHRPDSVGSVTGSWTLVPAPQNRWLCNAVLQLQMLYSLHSCTTLSYDDSPGTVNVSPIAWTSASRRSAGMSIARPTTSRPTLSASRGGACVCV